MNIKKQLTMLFLLLVGVGTSLMAQTAVTAGSQVTDAASLVSGKAYLLQHQGNGNNTPWLEDAGTYYNCPNSAGNCTLASVWYLIDNGDDTWKIQNAYTGKYWPKPVGNANLVGTDEANAGNWALNFSSGVAAPTCNGYRLNRNTPYLVGWNSGSGYVTQVKVYDVTVPLSTAAAFSEFTDKDISVSATEAATVTTGTWYVMKNRGRNGYLYEDASKHTLYNQAAAPGGLAVDNAQFLVRLVSGTDGKYYLQNGLGNYMGVIPQNTTVPVTALREELITVSKINGTDGHYYLQSASNSEVLDCQENGHPVVGWGTTVPTSTGGNNDWAFYPVELVEAWVPTISEVYTFNCTTSSNRGALVYNETMTNVGLVASANLDATNANHQWVIVPTATEKQYYLYNVGAGKFAIPTAIAQGGGYPWVFSDNAVAVVFLTQSDGTKRIKMAVNPVSGNNQAVIGVNSNNSTGPVFNYNDAGSNFILTKVDGVDHSVAATAAVSKLIGSQTPLTSYPQASGWYAIQIKSKSGSSTYAGRFLQSSETLYNGLYPLTFTGAIDVNPAVTDPTFLTYINHTDWDVNTWQMPDGRYLVKNSSSKFPTPSATPGNVMCGFDNGNYFKVDGNWFADPYNSNATYFVGETTTMRTAYNVYPVDLAAAGMEAWQVVCDAAPESALISCSRSDVKGASSVYKGGFFFLPAGVTPESTDFTLEGASGVTVDATAKTITFAYDPNLAMVEGSITTAQGWQTAGRGGEVMLLKVDAAPFKDATNVSLSVNMKDGSESNISKLTLYEANTNSPEIYSTGTGAPTKTQIDQVTVSGSTATFNIGNLTTGNHYYWIGATVKDDATLGAVIDLAVTGITYTCNSNETVLDLTSVGDPADRGAMVFNTQSYAFLPRDNGSRVYRIPAMVVADDGSIVVACDKRYDSHTDIGNGHIIDIVIRRSTDGGKTWGEPVVVAKGEGIVSGDGTRCGYGDPSLIKGNDGKIYCLFGAGNIGYFYGLNRICLSVSEDNGVTWSSSAANPPADLVSTGKVTDHANNYGGSNVAYGLYDYFVTSGRGLCTSEGYLMGLLPAQAYTTAAKSSDAKTGNSHDYVFYSTDGGATWHISEQPIFAGGDEAKVIQANDGSLIASVRQGGNRGFNTATYTKNEDGTLTFTLGTQYNNSQLNAGGYANNQDILYYQRETDEGKTDIIFHSMTVGQHANFKLYYSTDKGTNWTEFLTVQTKGTRYVTMERSANGSLYLFFEDQSLNSAGGYTDYNHYPLNFVEITHDQLAELIPELDEYQLPDYLGEATVNITNGLTGETSLGSWSGNTWTSNAGSGVAGLTMTLSNGTHDKFSNFNGRYNLAYRPATANTEATITLTAPEGYTITGYSMESGVYQASTYTLTTADGQTITPANLGGTYTPISVTGLNTTSTVIGVTTTNAGKWLSLANISVTLASKLALNVCGDASYATLYLPVDAQTDGNTKAYYITTANNGFAQLIETPNEGTDIPAFTAVVLINDQAEAATPIVKTSGLTSVVSQDDNLLKGTLFAKTLDLSDASPYYTLGKQSDKVGFYKMDDASFTLSANKAYLEVVGGTGSKGFIFTFDDITGIQEFESLSVRKSEIYYTIDGRKMKGQPTAPGIYVTGKGKKVIVR
ncbi:MAG: exo-alpha-sialidase [Bacteroidaceae bacterium]|nr:exo-alpha-sialidase [Bacteroidaceae bacterium]